MSLYQQFQSILLMILGGFIIGFAFDGYRILKGRIIFKEWIVFIIDVLYGITSALLIFSFLLWSNHGQLRVSIILAILFGLWSYYKTLSTSMIRLWDSVFSFFYSLWKFLIKTVQVIIIKPIILLYRGIIILIGFLATTFLAILSFLKRLSTPPAKYVYKKTRLGGNKIKSKIKKEAGNPSFVKNFFKKIRKK